MVKKKEREKKRERRKGGKVPDRRQRLGSKIILLCTTTGIPRGALVCMGKPIGREKTRVRTHVRRAAGLYASLHRSQGIFMD